MDLRFNQEQTGPSELRHGTWVNLWAGERRDLDPCLSLPLSQESHIKGRVGSADLNALSDVTVHSSKEKEEQSVLWTTRIP